jgi:predicted AlkP superfamily phosphohydrolase/phosphomutase
MKKSALFSVLVTLNFFQCSSLQKGSHLPTVVLVSIDGYRHDYTELYHPPHLEALKNEGLQANLLPVYPSKTFTNHYSIATGLYPENHGIVANSFYDPERKAAYHMYDTKAVKDGSWYRGEPIWVTAEKHHIKTATYFWPASEAAIQEIRPTYWYQYNKSTSHQQRIQQVQKWLELPESQRPHLILLYFSDVDDASHRKGPSQLADPIARVDRSIGELHALVTQHQAELFVVSDHGMEHPQEIVYLDPSIDLTGVRIEGMGTQMLLYFDHPQAIAKTLTKLNQKSQGHYHAFLRSEMPSRYHYAKNPRAGDIVIIAQSPYWIAIKEPKKFPQGDHGYDPDTTSSMQGIFYASGPHLQKKKKIPPFRNIHIYPLILQLLKIPPSHKIDGNPEVLAPYLNE